MTYLLSLLLSFITPAELGIDPPMPAVEQSIRKPRKINVVTVMTLQEVLYLYYPTEYVDNIDPDQMLLVADGLRQEGFSHTSKGHFIITAEFLDYIEYYMGVHTNNRPADVMHRLGLS